MKICVDENIPLGTVAELRTLGHDVLDICGTARQGFSDDLLWKLRSVHVFFFELFCLPPVYVVCAVRTYFGAAPGTAPTDKTASMDGSSDATTRVL